MITSISEGHSHTWKREDKFTSFDNGHKHKINLKRRLALPSKKGGHTHNLLGI